MKLGKRLQTIADLVRKNDIVADIGTDHGYIPIYLVKNNISKDVIASDINQGPVDKAVENVNKNNLRDYIYVIKADGLKGIKKRVDTIIIAGMGGLMISDIIEDDIEIAKSAKQLILQPMNNSIELRKTLIENGFKITSETIAIEGLKFYEIICAEKGKVNIKKEIEYEISKELINNMNSDVEKFILNKIDTVQKIIDKIEKDSKNNHQINIQKQRLKDIKEVYSNANKFKKSN